MQGSKHKCAGLPFAIINMMKEQWQLYDNQGNALVGQGATKDEVFCKGLLHGAAHVWIWRINEGDVEVLLQKRAANKQTWPNKFDISAAGHIDLGEEPLIAALRETKEEIGLIVNKADLKLININYAYMVAENKAIEHEFQWVYLLNISSSFDFTIQKSEVACLEWKKLDLFKAEVNDKHTQDLYVPHGGIYFQTVINAIEVASTVS
jgi:isopentenyldiphosphate isomerase